MKQLSEENLSPLKSSKFIRYFLILIASALVFVAASRVEVFALNSYTIPLTSGSLSAKLLMNSEFTPTTSVYDPESDLWFNSYVVPMTLQFINNSHDYLNGRLRFTANFSITGDVSKIGYNYISNFESTDNYIFNTYQFSNTSVRFQLTFLNYLYQYEYLGLSGYFLITAYSTSGNQPIHVNFSDSSSVSEPTSSSALRADSELINNILLALEDSNNIQDIVNYLDNIANKDAQIYQGILGIMSLQTQFYPIVVGAINQNGGQLHSDYLQIYNYVTARDQAEASGASVGASVNESIASDLNDADEEVDEAQQDIVDSIDVDVGDIDDLNDSALSVISTQSTSISFWGSVVSAFASRSGILWSCIVISLTFGLFLFILRLKS